MKNQEERGSRAAKTAATVALLLGSVAFAGWRVVGSVTPPASISTPPPRPFEAELGRGGPDGPPERGERREGRGGPGGPGGERSPEQWRAQREEFAKSIGITPEQQAKLDALRQEMGWGRGGPGGPGGRGPGGPGGPPDEMMKKMAEILTPEQMTAMRGQFMQRAGQRMSRQVQRAAKFLPPDQVEKMKQLARDRMQQIANGPPGGPGRGPGGGRP